MAWYIKRGEMFYLGWNDPHTKRDRYKSLRTDDEEIAKRAVLKKDAELGQTVTVKDSMEEAPGPGGLSIDGLIARYVKATKLAPSTRRINSNSWQLFKNLTGALLINAVKKETVVDFATKLEAKKYTSAYISMCLRDLRKLWKFAIEEELVTKNPFKSVDLPRDEKVARNVTEEDERLIINGATPWLKRFIQVKRRLGLRPTQVCFLDWKQFDLRGKNLIIPKHKNQPERIIPIFDDLLPLLGPERVSGPIFSEFDGMTKEQALSKVNREWQRARRRAMKQGLRGRFRPYDLRHAKASELAKDLNAYELMDYFGWSTVKMTDRYVHTRIETIRQKIASRHKRDTSSTETSDGAHTNKPHNA